MWSWLFCLCCNSKQKGALLICCLGCCTVPKNIIIIYSATSLWARPTCVYFTDLKTWKQLYEITENWQEHKKKKDTCRGRMRVKGRDKNRARNKKKKRKEEAHWYETLKEALNDEVFKSTVTIGSVLTELHLPAHGCWGKNHSHAQLFHCCKAESLFQKKSIWREYLAPNAQWK